MTTNTWKPIMMKLYIRKQSLFQTYHSQHTKKLSHFKKKKKKSRPNDSHGKKFK